jgi:membrane associated rhomboid family serine protease
VIIPIGHDQAVRRMPWVTISIIAFCTLVQLYATFVAPNEDDIGRQYLELTLQLGPDATAEDIATVERYLEHQLRKVPVYGWGYKTGSGLTLGLVTSAFVHGGWFHLIGNMLFLWLAGSALEDRYGRLRFSVFYVLGAVFATFAFSATYRGDPTTLVGASGAISACMGAFLVHFRKTEITFWYLIAYRSGTFRWPASLALPLWLAEQVLWAVLYGAMGMVSGIAYSAHIGGFVAGVGLAFASSKLFPQDAAEDDVEYDEPVPARPPQTDAQLDARIEKCLAALQARDIATVRMLSSRVILDLARVDHDGRILDLYRALEKQLPKVPLTDGAFAAAATAADRLNDRRGYIAIATAMLEEHPGSGQAPKVLWRLAQLHREAGDHALEQDTLQTLAQRFPRDELGKKAQLELDRQT